MAERQRIRLRPLTAAERAGRERVARAGSERANRGAGPRRCSRWPTGPPSPKRPARSAAGRATPWPTWSIASIRKGRAALDRRYGGGPAGRYGPDERERILREVRRRPDREEDRTATWSLKTLQQALRQAPDGLPTVSTATILHTLWEAGYTRQQDRSWCTTGTAKRKREDGSVVEAVDPQAAPEKS